MENPLDINSSIWVSASAGSGKTTILVNRLLMLLLNNVDISKILCITYTKTAAAEMKERVYKILSQWTSMSSEDLELDIKNKLDIVDKSIIKNARILFAKIIDNIDNLKIFTIHSFCQQIISRFPIEANIYPNFELLDEYKSKNIIREIINKVILDDTLYENFKLLITDNHEDDFISKITDVVEKRKDLYNNENYEYKIKKVLKLTEEDKNKLIKKYFLDYDYTNIIDFYNFIKEFGTDAIINRFSIIDNFLKDKEKFLDEYINIFTTKTLEIRKINNKKILSNEYMMNIYNNEANKCIEYINNVLKIETYNFSKAIINIATKVIDEYNDYKNKNGLLDFDDLLIYTHKLLDNTEYSDWINYKLDGNISHILLDEAQDTSYLQWKIFEKLTGDFFVGETKNNENRTIFVVGDEKQSIFKFQGAKPEMFEEKYYYYKDLIENSRKNSGKNFKKIKLEYSYRSLKEILDFVDSIFSENEYLNRISKLDKSIKHKNIRRGDGLVEIWPLINLENEDKIKKFYVLSDYISKKINILVNSNRAIITKNGEKRKIEYGDIMILLRTRDKAFLSSLITNLNKNKIPNSGSDRINLFDNIIVKDIISLLNFIIFNNDDLSLANIIKSPIINLNEDDLFKLCIYKNENNTTLFESLKVNYFEKYNILLKIIDKSNDSGIYDTVFYIIENFNIKQNIIDRFGDDFLIIIEKFYDFIINFEKNYSNSIVSFVNFVSNNVNDIKKNIDVSENNVVKIMTVHASKGLQSPIIFLCQTNTLSKVDNEENLWYDDIPIYKITNESTNYIKKCIENDIYDEYLRLLYVATTRAENELYICDLGDENNKKTTWYNLCKDAILKLKSKEENFDFDDKMKKIVYGKENYLERNYEENIIKEKENVLDNIKKYKSNFESKKIINPSEFFKYVDKDNSFDFSSENILKGEAIHKLLEILPTVKDKNKIADLYLNNMFSKLNNKEIIKKQAIDIIDKYNLFFGQNSKAEVSVIGKINNNIISGRIDRMVELDDKVIIIDYKNTKKQYTEKDIPEKYVKQLSLYKQIIQDIYKNKQIECYILLTSFCKLLKINI